MTKCPNLNFSARGIQSSFLLSNVWVKSGFIGAALIAVALRALITIKYANLSNPTLWEFGIIAKNLIETGTYSYRVGGVTSAIMPPGYPLIIAFFYKVFGVGIAAHAALAFLLLCFEIGICILIWRVASQIWNRNVGAVAFLISLFWPHFLLMSGRLHPVPIYTALLIFACGVLFSNKLSVIAKACLCGVILGLYANFRFDAIPLMLPFVYYLVRIGIPGKNTRLVRSFAVSVLVICFLIPLTPWLARNHAVFGEFLLSTSGGYNLHRGHHEKATGAGRDAWPAGKLDPDAPTGVPQGKILESLNYDSPEDELIADRWHGSEAYSYIAGHPKREVRLALTKLYYFLVADFTHPVERLWLIWVPSLLALVIGFGFWIRCGAKDIRQQVLWLLFVIQMGISVIFYVLPRYRMVVDFIPLVFFSACIFSFWLFRHSAKES